MRKIITAHQAKILIILTLCTLVMGIGAGSYLIHRYSVKGVPSFKREYDLVLKTYDGADVRLASFKNKVLVVTAWASWCPYCKAEIENLATIANAHPDEVAIVAVNRGESIGDAKSFSDALAQASHVQFFLDPNDSFYKELGGYAMPETLFIDAYGHVLFHQRGPMTSTMMAQKVEELLK